MSPPCATFQEIYGNGKNLCEVMFNYSYSYVPVNSSRYNQSYAPYFLSTLNPNDAVSALINKTRGGTMPTNDLCRIELRDSEHHLQYKKYRSPNANMTECQAFSSNACCPDREVSSPDVINNLNGATYRWDRCGPLSQSCERFFVQEACFYQCDSNVGLWQLYPQAVFNTSEYEYENVYLPQFNTWQIHNMPVKGDYCDLWFESCKFDKFCADDSGDFFSCPMSKSPTSSPVKHGTLGSPTASHSPSHALTLGPTFALTGTPTHTAAATGLSAGAIAGITIASVFVFALLIFVVLLVWREKTGAPLFSTRLDQQDARPIQREGEGASSSFATPQPQHGKVGGGGGDMEEIEVI